jgi:SAM-dependent methyltransferase
MSEKTNNAEAYKGKYADGYGLVVPDGHIIRIYKQIVSYQCGMTSGRVFDFGTGNGTHLAWLRQQGAWDVAGVDLSDIAIAQAQKLMPDAAANLRTVDKHPDLKGMFDEPFDLIIANQVLYYVDNAELAYLIGQFHAMLRPGGIFYASMMGPENYYYKRSEPQPGSDLRKVTLQGRLNETTFVNFKSREQMLKDFAIFEKLHAGYYDTTIREDEGSTMHHFFVGRKA